MKTLLAAMAYFRPAAGILYFLMSLLAVLPAPTYGLFVLAVGMTEWGHFFAVLCLTLTLPGWERVKYGWIGAVFGALAFLFALTPLLRAFILSATIDDQLAVFGEAAPLSPQGAPARPKPLVFGDLLFGVHSNVVTKTTHEFAVKSGQSLELDLYSSGASVSSVSSVVKPIVVVVHGGSWRSGSRSEPESLNKYLAAHGYLVASIDYRFAPKHRFPAGVEDVDEAVAWLKKHAARWAGDPKRIVLMGRSAGGHLALLAAYRAKDPAIRGVVGFYAPADLRFAWANPSNPWVLDTPEVLSDFLGGPPEAFGAGYDAASAYDLAGKDSPPTLLIHGTRDELVWVRQGRRLEEKLRAAGVRSRLLEFPWATHGFDYNFSGPGGQLSTYAVERFLSSVFN